MGVLCSSKFAVKRTFFGSNCQGSVKFTEIFPEGIASCNNEVDISSFYLCDAGGGITTVSCSTKNCDQSNPEICANTTWFGCDGRTYFSCEDEPFEFNATTFSIDVYNRPNCELGALRSRKVFLQNQCMPDEYLTSSETYFCENGKPIYQTCVDDRCLDCIKSTLASSCASGAGGSAIYQCSSSCNLIPPFLFWVLALAVLFLKFPVNIH